MSDVVSGHIINKRCLSPTCTVLTVVVPFEPGDSKRYVVGRHIALALMEQDFPKVYGDQAQILFKAGFFNNPQVLKAIGSDDQYNEWVRMQPSAVSKQNGCESNPMEAAHIRMIAEGAGTAIKNQYATIPLLHSEHQEQHTKGYEALGGKEKLTGLLYQYRLTWAKEVIKYRMGTFESFAQIPPPYFIHWCRRAGIETYLPREYREASQ